MAPKIKLNVSAPCQENWDHMQPRAEGRHCFSCSKTVVDFTGMSDRQILDFLGRSGTEICGRLDGGQLNRNLRESPGLSRPVSFPWRIFLAGLLSTGALPLQASSPDATTSGTRVLAVQFPHDKKFGTGKSRQLISGRILDEKTGEPIPFASIGIAGGLSGVSADAEGRFYLEVNLESGPVVLQISAVGYALQEITIQQEPAGELTLFLSPQVQEMEAARVKANLDCSRVTMGLLISQRVVGMNEKIRRSWGEFTGQKEVRVLPNPVSAGQSFRVELNLPDMGIYDLELIDAQGRILYRRGLRIENAHSTIDIPMDGNWSRGVYWIRVSSTFSKKLFNGRLLLG